MDLNKCVIGLELGSTRIKAIMLDENNSIIAQGFFDWENKLVDGIWTYDINLVEKGLKTCYSNLKQDFETKYNIKLTNVGEIGISGMMHGYLAFDENDNLLVPFRTWRNTMTQR